jgi:hypothetical protein
MAPVQGFEGDLGETYVADLDGVRLEAHGGVVFLAHGLGLLGGSPYRVPEDHSS